MGARAEASSSHSPSQAADAGRVKVGGWMGLIGRAHPTSPSSVEDGSVKDSGPPPVPEGWRPSWSLVAGSSIALIAALSLLELLYSASAVPPGVDPGHWITSGYGYVGHPVPPLAAIGSPYLYPPLAPLLVGGLYVFLGSPITTALAAGGLLLVLFAISLVLIARRFLWFGPAQVGFVGAAILCGTTLSMLFWGAYPNFLGFFFLDLVVVALLEYARRPSKLWGLLLPLSVGAVYLTHSLVFFIAGATVGVAGLLLLLAEGPHYIWKRIWNPGFLLGCGVLVGIIAAYTLTLRFEHIVPPAYVGGNPAAYQLDGLGGFFTPLSSAPSFFPLGPGLFLPASAVALLLGGSAAALALGWLAIRRRRPQWTDVRFPVALGMLLAAVLVPVAGWIAHIATDYDRFIYFLPTPALLLLVLTIERGVAVISPESLRTGADPQYQPRTRPRSALAAGYIAAGVILVLLFTNVTVPMALDQDQIDTGPAHSSDFLAAAQWLSQNPAPGNVLTLQSSARWIEALTSRGAFDIGPTWLDFEGWQILDSQQAYYALNSAYAVTDNAAVFSFTNPASPILSQTPMYSILSLGIPVPVCRLLVGGSTATVVLNGSTVTLPGSAWGPATLAVGPSGATATLSYNSSLFSLSIEASATNGSAAMLAITATGRNGSVVTGLSLELGGPPTGVALLSAGTFGGIVLRPQGFQWNTTKSLGPLPSPSQFVTTGTFSAPPIVETQGLSPNGPEVTAQFERSTGTGPYAISLALSTPGSGNPGVTLPPVLSAAGFLASNDIHFLFILETTPYIQNVQLFEATLGFHVVYANSSWEILER